MAETTQIHPDKVWAYLATDYRLGHTEHDIILNIGVRSARLALRSIEGSGSEEGKEWPAEKSYFALGLQLDAAKLIGRHFDQDAIVWVGGDEVPQLILLR